MNLYLKSDIKKKLISLGICKGDTLFVTTSLGMLGIPKDFRKKKNK